MSVSLNGECVGCANDPNRHVRSSQTTYEKLQHLAIRATLLRAEVWNGPEMRRSTRARLLYNQPIWSFNRG